MKFGTDGIRGPVGAAIDGVVAWRVGHGLGRHLGGGAVAVGRDTRPSGPALAQAVIAGLRAAGVDAIDCGVLPTPALAAVVRAHRLAGGVMVTASHNLADDNGLKVLGAGGDKADVDTRAAIEGELAERYQPVAPGPRGALRPAPTLDAWDPLAGVALRGVRIVLDAANGAAHGLGADRLRAAGASVTVLGTGEGRAINARCGALHPEAMVQAMTDADVGIALDGDGDRLALAVRTDTGVRVLDGDAVLHVLGQDVPAGGAVVGTVMSNLALEQGLGARGVRFVRTAVGDAEVWAAMEAHDARIGGEPSGHLMFRGGASDPVGSCGLATAARVLALGLDVVRARLAAWSPATQRAVAVPRLALRPALVAADAAGIADAVAPIVQALTASGARVVVRPSGTEPIVRVMVEHVDPAAAAEGCDALVNVLREQGGQA